MVSFISYGLNIRGYDHSYYVFTNMVNVNFNKMLGWTTKEYLKETKNMVPGVIFTKWHMQYGADFQKAKGLWKNYFIFLG